MSEAVNGNEIEHASFVRPYPGERASGDAAIVCAIENGWLAAIVDVLGHGAEAGELADAIRKFLEVNAARDVSDLMQRLHRRLKGTRGAAAGLCALDAPSGRLIYAGTGNTVIRRFGSGDTRLVSRDGVIGQNMRTPHPQELQLEPSDVVVLYTDGIKDRFTSEDYPGVQYHEARIVAETIVGRFGKAHDDAACIALRWRRGA